MQKSRLYFLLLTATIIIAGIGAGVYSILMSQKNVRGNELRNASGNVNAVVSGNTNSTGVNGAANITVPDPTLPSEPKNADAPLKAMYKKAVDAQATRLKNSTYGAFLAEGLEWKTVADFSTTDKNIYYEYAAFVYTQAGKKFPKEWVPWLNVGTMFERMANNARAEQAYKQAVEIGAGRYEPLNALLGLLSMQNLKPTRAVMDYFKPRIVGVSANQTALTISYARYLLQYREITEALGVLKAVIAVNPDPQLKAELADLEKFVKENAVK